MIIGIPREIKTNESRVAMLPVGAELLTKDGHAVLIERGAGIASGFEDDAYVQAGAELVDTAKDVFDRAEMIVKVKEPQQPEIAMMRKDLLVFTYFHFAASRDLTAGCLDAGIYAVAYETLKDAHGQLPLLTPMSEVAGRMAVQEGAKYLEAPMGGRGILLGGVPGVPPAEVLVIGGGVSGTHAAQIAAGMGANVVLMDINLQRLRYLDEVLPANVSTVYSDPHAIREYAQRADLIIGAVLLPGARAPKLITREILRTMKPGAVMVDIAIDQGGCFETSRPTTHQDPIYVEEKITHYCVANIPGAVSRTSTIALCNATLPYARELAKLGPKGFAAIDVGRAAAVNMRGGKIVHPAVAEAFEDLPRE